MAFSFFKDKTENNEDNNLSSIFKKIKLNPKVTPNRSLSHDIPDENMFSSVNSYNDPFTANPVDENRIVQESTASINQQCNPQTPFENRNENLFSEINKPAAGQVPAASSPRLPAATILRRRGRRLPEGRKASRPGRPRQCGRNRQSGKGCARALLPREAKEHSLPPDAGQRLHKHLKAPREGLPELPD